MRKIILSSILLIMLLAACQPADLESTRTPLPPTITPQPPVKTAVLPSPTALPTAEPGSLQPFGFEPLPWWNDTVFYEIFVRSFADSNGDGIGDFTGLTDRLDYLNDGDPTTSSDLGITGIWLMPVHPSPSYHGYDVSDYRSINPQYGTIADFQEFITQAHRRGIKVIIDLVINHTSVEHPWFAASVSGQAPYSDYYVWSPVDPGWKGPDGQTVWHQAGNGKYYYGFFWSGMPDLNYQNPAVTEEIHAAAQYWLKDIGVDGFRMDAARHLVEEGRSQLNTPATHAWLQGFHQMYKSANPDALVIGEIWDRSSAVAKYTQGDQLDLAFDFDLANAWMISADSKDARPARSVLRRDTAVFKTGQFGVFLTNHDQNRVMSQFNGDRQKAKAAAVLLLTSPGVPFIYYGEEIGMSGVKPDEDIRTPMQWGGEEGAGFTASTPWRTINADYPEVNVQRQAGDADSLLSWYRDLIRLRNDHPALRQGWAWDVEPNDKAVYALLRATDQEALLILANLGPDPVAAPTLKLASGPLRGTFTLTPVYGDGSAPSLSASATGGFEAYQPLDELPGYSLFVFSLDLQ